MLTDLKALVVVLCVSYPVFRLAAPICFRFTRQEDFYRRRMVWFVLTTVAFLAPSFWLYVLVAIPLLAWSARRDANPASIYFLMYFVIPPIRVYIPVVGINQLFDLNQFRILSLTVLLPVAWRLFQSPERGENNKFTLTDTLVLSYALLCLVQFVPYESPTNTMRRAFELFLDSIVVYYVFSRLALSRAALIDTLAAFCLACAIFAPLAVFESVKAWLLYANLGERWGVPNEFAYLMRGESLRAQVSTGHALALGSVLATGFAFWLYLQSRIPSRFLSLLVAGLMWIGMLAAYSRAPWIMAALMFFLFLLLSPRGMSKFVKWALLAGVVGGIVLVSPLGDRIVDNLPFVGSVDQANVVYRQELARLSWILIQENPFFGDPFVLRNMESLRQGQGIIDLVNGFASVALFHGLVGLSLFCGIFTLGMWRTWLLLRHSRLGDPDLSLLGASLLACMLGTLFFVATAGLSSLLFPLTGLLASYANLALVADSNPGRSGGERGAAQTLSSGRGGRLHAR